MYSSKLCFGKTKTEWRSAGDFKLNWFDAQRGERPTGVKRVRLTCPVCKRRVLASVRTCEDGCCLMFTLPPHKPRYWWKKKHHPHGIKTMKG